MPLIEKSLKLHCTIQAAAITDAMVKHLEHDDDEEKSEYLSSMFFALEKRRLLPLAITMFQKYREVCPNKLNFDQMTMAADGKTKKVYIRRLQIVS